MLTGHQRTVYVWPCPDTSSEQRPQEANCDLFQTTKRTQSSSNKFQHQQSPSVEFPVRTALNWIHWNTGAREFSTGISQEIHNRSQAWRIRKAFTYCKRVSRFLTKADHDWSTVFPKPRRSCFASKTSLATARWFSPLSTGVHHVVPPQPTLFESHKNPANTSEAYLCLKSFRKYVNCRQWMLTLGETPGCSILLVSWQGW